MWKVKEPDVKKALLQSFYPRFIFLIKGLLKRNSIYHQKLLL